MDSSEQHDERELEVIREEMERKRAALADKLGALESQVLGSVQSASEAVSDAREVVASVKDTITDTVSSVKETVSDTVQSVADTLNVSRHVENHPWAALGCAVATGFAGGLLLGGSSKDEPDGASSSPRPAVAPAPSPGAPPASDGAAPQGLGSQILGSLGDTFERLTGGLQGLAVGSIMGLISQMAQSSLPDSVRSDVTRFLDDVTDKLGGKTTELSRQVVNYVSEAASSSKEEQASPSPQQPAGAKAAAATARQQHRNGSRHRAGSR